MARVPSRRISRTFFTSTPPSARSQLLSGTVSRGTIYTFRSEQSILSRGWRSLRSKSDKPTPNAPAPEGNLSFSQRMKKLSREYGWAALGVYMALTVLDFPFCFLAVRSLGTERIGHYEHVVVEAFKSTFGLHKDRDGDASPAGEGAAQAKAREGGELGYADDIEEAEAQNRGATACMKPTLQVGKPLTDTWDSNLDRARPSIRHT